MSFAAVQMAVAILLICFVSVSAVQLETARDEHSAGRAVAAQGLMRKEQQQQQAAVSAGDGNLTGNDTGNDTGNYSTAVNPAYDIPESKEELMEFDPVWAYGPNPDKELLQHRQFNPTECEGTAHPPRNYVYCHQGGATGPSFAQSMNFKDAPFPKPPMTIAATISTTQMGRFQVFLGWAEGKNTWDAAEFRLTATGNLQYGINDGLAWHNVEAKPALNLIDGQQHHVALVRDANGVADLFINGTRVGFGLIAGNPRVPLTTARAARVMYGLRDLAFTGNISGVFVYDRALRWWEVNKVPFVPCREEKPVMTRVHFDTGIEHRNLGGLGPDHNSPLAQPYSMRFEGISNYGGVLLDMLVVNTTPYEPRNYRSNGMVKNGSTVGHINILSGTSVGLRFELVASKTCHPVVVDNFYFAFMDIDSGPYGTGRESLAFTTDVANWYIASDSTLKHSHPIATTNLVVWAGDQALGDYTNNPTEPMDLDDEQEKRSVVLVFARTSGFEVVFNSTPGIGGRDISFSGWSTLMLDAFNLSLGQGYPQTSADLFPVDPMGHMQTGDEMSAGAWES